MGGNPPRDNISSGARAVSTGDFDHELARLLMEVALFNSNSLKAENVRIT